MNHWINALEMRQRNDILSSGIVWIRGVALATPLVGELKIRGFGTGAMGLPNEWVLPAGSVGYLPPPSFAKAWSTARRVPSPISTSTRPMWAARCWSSRRAAEEAER